MTTTRALGLLAASVLILPLGARSVRAVEEAIVSPERMTQYVIVRDVSALDDGTVSGVVVNTSSKPVRDVRLLIRQNFLWKNERRPGNDDPSQASYYTLPQEIPPGGQVPFSFRPQSPLPRRTDGHFDSEVQVAGVTEMVPGSTATGPTSGSPESGTRGPVDPGVRGSSESGTRGADDSQAR